MSKISTERYCLLLEKIFTIYNIIAVSVLAQLLCILAIIAKERSGSLNKRHVNKASRSIPSGKQNQPSSSFSKSSFFHEENNTP